LPYEKKDKSYWGEALPAEALAKAGSFYLTYRASLDDVKVQRCLPLS
jgi:hypothetical protein